MEVAVVTGGSSGIGEALCKSLVKDGIRTLILDRQMPDNPIDGAEYMLADLGKPESLDEFGEYLKTNSIKVDFLVNCAAVAQKSSFMDTPREEWQRILHINLEGVFALVQAVVPSIVNGGRIVLFASGVCFRGSANQSAYVAAKMGCIGLARCLATELGEREVTVNTITPGLTRTPMIKILEGQGDAKRLSPNLDEQSAINMRALKRPAYAEDIVGPIRFLLSPAAAFITGQNIPVDGGSNKQ